MRRSDEEFKAELKARAGKYRAAQERCRAAVLKTASAVMAACLLIVVVAQVDFSWVGERPEVPTVEGTTGDITSAEESIEASGDRESVSGPDESRTDTNVENTVGGDEMVPGGEAPEDSLTIEQITVALLSGVHYNDAAGDSEVYTGSDVAAQLAAYLKELADHARVESDSSGVEEGTLGAEGVVPATEELEVPEAGGSGDTDEEAPAEGPDSAGKKTSYGFAVRYSDGSKALYEVRQGEDGPKRLEDGTLVLDDDSWQALLTMLNALRESGTDENQ